MVTQPAIEVCSFGMWDSLILMVMALVVFGPRRLPQIGRQIGKLMYEVRKASNDFKFQMEEELRSAEDADRKQKEAAQLQTLPPPATVPVTLESVEQAAAVASNAEPVKAPTTENPYPNEEIYRALAASTEEKPNPYPAEQPHTVVAAAEVLPAPESPSAITPAPEQAPHD